MDAGYLTHLPLLAVAATITTGPVLELGAGFGSTLMLHGLCGACGRRLVTLESDQSWLGMFIPYRRPWHEIKHVEDFKNLPEYDMEWGLALVDHGIAEQRGQSVEALQHVPLIVVHDTCHPMLYNYDSVLGGFKYRFDYKVVGPMTTLVSHVIDFETIKELNL